MVANYHTHTLYSDGHAHPVDYVRRAREKSLSAIGFSDHAPLPYANNFAMATQRLEEYARNIERLAEENDGSLQVWKGLEVDYIPEAIYPGHPDYYGLYLDYIIGAVHYVDFYPDGRPWNVDGSIAEFEKGLREIFKGDIKAAVTRYYELQFEMVLGFTPTILAHIDRIKRHNFQQEFFSTDERWYKEAIACVLDAMAAKGTILEVNTKGFYSSGEPEFYPSADILKMAYARNIPVHPAADAHHPDHIDTAFELVLELLNAVGYTHVHQFQGNNWKPVAIQSIMPALQSD